MRTNMVLDSLEMARWSRGTRLEGLVAHSDAGSQGGFNRWMQHLEMEVSRDGVQASAGAGGSGDAREDLVAGPAVDGTSRAQGPVLGSDRSWPFKRRRCGRGRHVIRGRGEVVPGSWRHAASQLVPDIGPLLVFRRT
jgi:hypothetical protein